MTVRAIDVILKGHDQLSPSFRSAGHGVSSFHSSLFRLRNVIAGVFGGYIIKRSFTEITNAYRAQQDAAGGLSSALTIIGQDAAKAMPDLIDYASEIQNITKYSDDLVLETMKMGVNIAGLSGNNLKRATIAAIGLSKAFKIDLEKAMKLVSKAAMGNTGALARYGIVLDDSMTAQEKYNKILGIGVQKFELAKRETGTLSGKLAQISNAYMDLKENIGQAVWSIADAHKGWADYVIRVLKVTTLAVQQYQLTWGIASAYIRIKLHEINTAIRDAISGLSVKVLTTMRDDWLKYIDEIVAGTISRITSIPDEIRKGIADKLKGSTGGTPAPAGAVPAAGGAPAAPAGAPVLTGKQAVNQGQVSTNTGLSSGWGKVWEWIKGSGASGEKFMTPREKKLQMGSVMTGVGATAIIVSGGGVLGFASKLVGSSLMGAGIKKGVFDDKGGPAVPIATGLMTGGSSVATMGLVAKLAVQTRKFWDPAIYASVTAAGPAIMDYLLSLLSKQVSDKYGSSGGGAHPFVDGGLDKLKEELAQQQARWGELVAGINLPKLVVPEGNGFRQEGVDSYKGFKPFESQTAIGLRGPQTDPIVNKLAQIERLNADGNRLIGRLDEVMEKVREHMGAIRRGLENKTEYALEFATV